MNGVLLSGAERFCNVTLEKSYSETHDHEWWDVCRQGCEAMQPTHEDRMSKVNECKEQKCDNVGISMGLAQGEMILWGWDNCVYKSESFQLDDPTAGTKGSDACLASCNAAGGPQPASPQRCYATMS
jgi:hypothetical protein